MNEIYKKLPIKLIQILNDFNEELKLYKKFIELNFSIGKIKYDIEYDQINVIYRFKKTEFYFEITFVINKDYISWVYYPHLKNSTKKKLKTSVVTNEAVYNELVKNLRDWNSKLSEIHTLKNPVSFFSDRIIEFYADEVLQTIDIYKFENELPLTSKRQKKALTLLEKHREFIEKEIKETEKASEKYNDLNVAKTNIIEIEKNITRMTISEVKQKWSIAFGVIMKWSAEKFIQFIKLDKASGLDVSRMLGSFIGGIFGIPKVE